MKKLTHAQITAAVAARDRASAGAPKAVLAAFFPDPVTIGGLQLQPLTLATYMLLEKIGSPLMVAGGQPNIADVLRAALMLTLPLADALPLATDGAALDAATYEFAEKFPIADIKPLGEKISAHIAAAFDPASADTGDSGLGEHPSPATGLGGP